MESTITSPKGKFTMRPKVQRSATYLVRGDYMHSKRSIRIKVVRS